MKVAHKSTGKIKCKENDVEAAALYEVLEKLPKPEASMKLNSSQKKWWYWFGVEFISTNQLTKLDLIHLQQAAFWMDARCQAIRVINEKGYEGLVQTFKTKATNITGHVSILEKADKNLDSVSAHFGLSIRDRSKLKAVKTSDDSQLSLFEEIMKELHG